MNERLSIEEKSQIHDAGQMLEKDDLNSVSREANTKTGEGIFVRTKSKTSVSPHQGM